MLLSVVLAVSAVAAPALVRDGPRLRGTVEVAADAETVRALVREPLAIAEASGRDLQLEPLPGAHPCPRYALSLSTPLGAQGGTIETCPTADGVRVEMIGSRHFRTYAYRWQVAPTPRGTARVTYTLEVRSALPVPNAWVQGITRRAVRATLTQLGQWRPEA